MKRSNVIGVVIHADETRTGDSSRLKSASSPRISVPHQKAFPAQHPDYCDDNERAAVREASAVRCRTSPEAMAKVGPRLASGTITRARRSSKP